MRFGRYLVIGRSDQFYGSIRLWDCLCDCGSIKAIASQPLRSGVVKSCGCHKAESARKKLTTHGQSRRSSEYSSWANMKHRCGENAQPQDKKNYVDRGITVCDRWLSFENFYEDMGPKPTPEHQIDRRDNNGNYEPGNCRWVLLDIQSVNRRNNDIIEYGGKQMAFKRAWEASDRIVSYGTAHNRRWALGWDPAASINTPVMS